MEFTSKKVRKLIHLHRAKNGSFECVEQLLDLPKFEPTHIMKICNSLLEDLSLQTLEDKLAEGKIKKYKPLFSKGIIPKPDLKQFSNIKDPTFVGVSVTLQGIAYTKIDSKKNLIGWSILPGVEDPTSQNSFRHQPVFSLASEIVNNLPPADYYLFEELLPILPKDPYMKHKVNLIKLRTTLLTLLMMSNQEASVGIHTIKPNVLDTLFSLKVGNERTSIQERLEQIISEDPFTLQISKDAWDTFNDCNTQGKEYLSASLLKTLAFNFLCLEAEDGFQ